MSREQMIVGLYSPAPQSGKSTVARELARYGFVRKGFSDALKAMTKAFLMSVGYSEASASWFVFDGAGKMQPIAEAGERTSRYLQQTLGTEWGRELVDTDVWVRAVINDRAPDLMVIDDLRFPNEYDAIREAGGQCWKVIRPGQERPNGHPSEGLLDDREFDEVIVNDGGLELLVSRTRNALIGD